MKQTNHYTSLSGFTMIEMMIVVSVITIIALIGYSNLGRYSEKTRRQEAVAMLSQYYALAKVATGELLCNPGNFVTLGFNPVGQIGSRIVAQNAACTLPVGYPKKDTCISTAFDREHVGNECKVPSPSPPPSFYYSPSWVEVAGIPDKNEDDKSVVKPTECPKVNGIKVNAINRGKDLEFRTLGCLLDRNNKPQVVCICHNGLVGHGETQCVSQTNWCKKQPKKP